MKKGDGINDGYIRNGAGNGVRTRDPQLGKLMLYQLSYSRWRKAATKSRSRFYLSPIRAFLSRDYCRIVECMMPLALMVGL